MINGGGWVGWCSSPTFGRNGTMGWAGLAGLAGWLVGWLVKEMRGIYRLYTSV